MQNFSYLDVYNQLKDEYNQRFLEELEQDTNKIDLFYEKVLPSMASPQNGSYACLFDSCVKSRKMFKNKQTYYRHLQTVHRHEMPGSGSFLTPNSAYYTPQYCVYCNARFSRKDKLADHLRTNKKCAKLQQVAQANSEQDCDSEKNYKYKNENASKTHENYQQYDEDTQDELVRLTQESVKLEDADELSQSIETSENECEDEYSTSSSDEREHSLMQRRGRKTKRDNTQETQIDVKKFKTSQNSNENTDSDEDDKLLLDFCIKHNI